MVVVDKIENDLFKYSINYMGFVEDRDAIKIKSAKIIDYEE